MIPEYLERVIAQFKSGQATEHSYRPALNDLFQSIDPSLTVINEPKQSEGGMPDFMFQRDGVPIGWAEAKDIDKDVIKLKGYSVDQRKRYEAAYPNLIYTNGVDFEFIRDGEPVHFVSIADFLMGLQPIPEKFDELERQLKLFAEQKPISIRSASKLAAMMAAKAAIIKDEIALALLEDPEFRSGLGGQFKSFKSNLLPNLEPGEFADIYAETITYGMFAARFHDDDLSTFSRQEAMEKLPASNPFLKGLFEYVAGPALPKRLTYIVDDLVEVMRASDPHSLFRDFGKFTARNDPFIHFYENFLAAYNPKKRKSRGVWYTPEPVVDFITRAVDEVLKTEFHLSDGLADTSKVTVDWDTGQNHAKTGKAVTEKRQVHKVQILDPATGTGTFLAKAVQLISDRVKSRAPGKWSGYVEQDLLPRLHGFELLMASYAMCHMKLDMQLTESGYKPSAKPPRLSVWLTNALEPAERDVRDLFFQPLAEEARGASEVKRQSPIMCIMGNPPYSGESANKGDHITKLMEVYKKEPGGKHPLDERNSKWLNDDYVKFIRMSEDLIAKNASGGVLGFISNHGFLNNPTFRGMRWHLLNSFDKIWVLDLHGSSNRKEHVPGGGADKNVFDIKPGVSIIICARGAKKSDELASVQHGDLWGTRAEKGAELFSLSLTGPKWSEIIPEAPHYMLLPWDYVVDREFHRGFSIEHALPIHSNGIVTGGDKTFIAGSEAALRELHGDDASIKPVSYRPFEKSFILDDAEKLERDRSDVMGHYQVKSNIGLLASKAFNDLEFAHSFVTTHPSEAIFLSGTSGSNAMNFPLWLFEESSFEERRTNLDAKLVRKLKGILGEEPQPEAVFDYIYGVLHDPAYRLRYRQALSIAYPHIPYPSSPEIFLRISKMGEALRRLHLMNAEAIGDTPYPYEGEGDDVVLPTYPTFVEGRVYVNPTQYFGGVPAAAWSFFIGGYQPAQKWLKDRRRRSLSWDEIGQYQKIIKILAETNRIMGEIKLPL
ncbi:type ISP restriction/modification enzyme [Brevundimonas sp.]|uniref:type ISP restriction/modification enzyme n=1 Tax=Brevundimonas sp. TaxID=1871086 RepID=UPI00272F4A77|nr:type ISP restriction/modification enzyme [Brevundimonas sp.]MDP1912163.1 type ISP restriction/modification enzyme [Brevundimonas sp.]